MSEYSNREKKTPPPPPPHPMTSRLNMLDHEFWGGFALNCVHAMVEVNEGTFCPTLCPDNVVCNGQHEGGHAPSCTMRCKVVPKSPVK